MNDRFSLKEKILLFLGGVVGGLVVRILKLSVKLELAGVDRFREFEKKGERFILIFWHGQMLVPMMRHIGSGIHVLVSTHRDGEIIARILKNTGCRSIRGSSTRGGNVAFQEMVSKLKKKSFHIAITPDGPKGPYHQLKYGALHLAASTGIPIVIFACSVDKYRQLKSWDRFTFVYPFSRCVFMYSDPIYVSPELSEENLKAQKKEIEREIERLNLKAREYLQDRTIGIKKLPQSLIPDKKMFIPLLIITRFLTPLYRFAIILRNKFYENGLLTVQSLSVPVIGVGNLTVGGTGKTPMVEWITNSLQQNGYKVGILSRGYRRKGKETIGIKHKNSADILLEKMGDEPYLLIQKLNGVPIIVDSDRYRAGQKAVDEFHCDVLVLDDAYQHIQISRSVNIVLIDCLNPFGNGKLIPYGILREPLSGLERADAVVLTRSAGREEALEKEIQRYSNAPIIKSRMVPVRLKDRKGNIIPLEKAAGTEVVAFCGIGNPASFYWILKELKFHIKRFVTFRDHVRYNQRNLKRFEKKISHSCAEYFVTTEKDLIKLPESFFNRCPVYAVEIELELFEGKEQLLNLIEKSIFSHKTLS